MNHRKKRKMDQVSGGVDITVTKNRLDVVSDKGSKIGLDLDISGNLNIFSTRG